jgi:cell division protein FtsB
VDFRVAKSKIKIVPQSQRHLWSLLAERAPQASALAARVAARAVARLRPPLALLFALRRRLATGAVGLLTVWLFVHVMFGANGMVIYKQKRAEYQSLQAEIGSLQKENDQYAGRIKALQTDPKTIEKEAREQLHYARPGEVVYVAPAPPPVERPSTDAARK